MDLAILLRSGRLSPRNANSGDCQVIRAQSLVVATRNEGKLEELRQLLDDLPLELYGLADFSNVETVPETGETFIENASLKAAGYATQTGLLSLADDSGLEVDALGGAPGIRSARYAGESASDDERVEALLAALAFVDETERSARFVSAVVIADSNREILN